MAKYDVTRACGHVEVVNLVGPGRNREWLLNAEARKLCADCYKAELERQNAEAAEKAEAMGLPALTGTEKQIAWAETLRLEILDAATDFVREHEADDPRALELIEHISGMTHASWWIDHRDIPKSEIKLFEFLAEMVADMEDTKNEAQPAAIEAKAEATIRPESPITETVAEIRPTETAVEISFPEKRRDFREIVKEKLYMRWDYDRGCWTREISYRTGTAADRAAEVGHRLLAAGIPIRIYDPDVRQRAIDGEYEPECRRWVSALTTGDHKGWFGISWDYSDDFYAAAKKIPGSRWDNPFVLVPPEQFEAILDFAEQYGFKLSPGAEMVLAEAEHVRDAALIADVTAPDDPERIVTGRKPHKLDVPEVVEIDEALRDDD